MAIYLGNLDVTQIENRLGVELSQNDREKLEGLRIHDTNEIHNAHGWHCYDIPFVIVCGCYELALIWRNILEPHLSYMTGTAQISGDWDGAPQPDEGYARKLKAEGVTLKYIGRDSFDRPVYIDGLGKIWKDVDPSPHRPAKLTSTVNNMFDGEPLDPMEIMRDYRDAAITFVPERNTWTH